MRGFVAAADEQALDERQLATAQVDPRTISAAYRHNQPNPRQARTYPRSSFAQGPVVGKGIGEGNDPTSDMPSALETGSQWSPFGVFYPTPHMPKFPASIMAVPRGDLMDLSQNPWPNNGQADHPNAAVATMGILRLRPHTSAHPGKQQPTGPSPTMLFRAPPPHGLQTVPIKAFGL